MISELPFKSTIPELGKIIDGIDKSWRENSRGLRNRFFN